MFELSKTNIDSSENKVTINWANATNAICIKVKIKSYCDSMANTFTMVYSR